jgi:hypothetical protein
VGAWVNVNAHRSGSRIASRSGISAPPEGHYGEFLRNEEGLPWKPTLI